MNYYCYICGAIKPEDEIIKIKKIKYDRMRCKSGEFFSYVVGDEDREITICGSCFDSTMET